MRKAQGRKGERPERKKVMGTEEGERIRNEEDEEKGLSGVCC